MNRNIIKFIVISFSIIFILFLILENNKVLESVNFSISIWKDNLFPTLFPFFVVSNILLSYNFTDIIGKIFNKPFKKLFKLPKECSFVLISSLFSGFPSGSKYTTSLINNKIITKEEGNKLLTFTHYSNPLFIIGFIGSIIFNNKIIGIIILLSHILSGLIVGIIFNYKNKNSSNNTIKKENKSISFGKILSNSIMDSLNTMFLLLGIITIFSLITSLIETIFNLDILTKSIISGILEMTQGIKNINNLDISIYFKIILTTTFISFGGLSVHMQVLAIISETELKYKSFFIARIIHAIIACIIVTILYLFTFQYYQ